MQPHAVLETALYARDLAAARRFFVEVLGMEVLAEQADRHVFFRCGRGMLLVFNPDSTAHEVTTVNGVDIPLHGVHGPTHMAFAMRESEIDAWRDRLRRAGVVIDSEVSWPAGGHSLYFRDPAGNVLELATPRLWKLPETVLDPWKPE
jgi:catechol 2,3-dioxygenase-like lactoylglutathione lyase family enzyme